MPENIAILGAGILGRSLAFRLSRDGYRVTVFEKRSAEDHSSASFIAGGMLAPYCELEHAPARIAELGVESIVILKNWLKQMEDKPWVQFNGTLVVSHHRDRSELQRLETRLHCLGYQDCYQKTNKGLFFAEEAHVCPKSLLNSLYRQSLKQEVSYRFATDGTEAKSFDLILDCRGLAAKQDLPRLRGVRGEVIEVESHEVTLHCPVRLMHPKYPVYIIPRPNHRFLIGATVIESEKMDPVTVQSAAELLSVAMTVHPSFAQANILSLRTQCRPAFNDHLPRIKVERNGLAINGLYRHGYLLSPLIAERISRHLKTGDNRCLSFC